MSIDITYSTVVTELLGTRPPSPVSGPDIRFWQAARLLGKPSFRRGKVLCQAVYGEGGGWMPY
jgi:hypothetical protein